MTPERWRVVKRLLQQALDRAGPTRAALLETAGADDPALRAEVEALLRADQADDSFLEPESITDLIGEILSATDPASAPPSNVVDLSTLGPGARLDVTTRNSIYHITVRDPGRAEILVVGGRFQAPTVGRLGRDGWIRLGGRMAVISGNREIVSGVVRAIVVAEPT